MNTAKMSIAKRITSAKPADVETTFSALEMAAANTKLDAAGRKVFTFDDGSIAEFDAHLFQWKETKAVAPDSCIITGKTFAEVLELAKQRSRTEGCAVYVNTLVGRLKSNRPDGADFMLSFTLSKMFISACTVATVVAGNQQ